MSASPPTTSTSPIASLFPGYFALVMATGIVAVAASQQNVDWLADVLYVVAAAAYVVLVVLLVVRIVRYWALFAADVTAHAKGFAFLTIVAGTNVLAAASIVIHGWRDLAWILWWIGIALWVVFLYTTLIAVVIGGEKPGLESGINGSWFLLTVSTESVAVVVGLLLARSSSDLLAFTGIAAFTLGVVLYVIVMTMVFLRWTFQPLDPTEADPPAWIAAGAVAITVLAGSNLLLASSKSSRIADLAPFIEGVVIMAWATSTFWFPLMVAIGVWRHLVRRLPLRYHPSYWALVFPLGMYGAATFRMRAAIDLHELAWLPKFTLAVALIAWTVTFVGLVHHGIIGLRSGRRGRTRAASPMADGSTRVPAAVADED
jgi:tellurite resistance protein TehA-like permease